MEVPGKAKLHLLGLLMLLRDQALWVWFQMLFRGSCWSPRLYITPVYQTFQKPSADFRPFATQQSPSAGYFNICMFLK